jgi:hypothetical protein
LKKIKIDYGWIFNPLQKWDLNSLKITIFTWNIGKIKNIIIIFGYKRISFDLLAISKGLNDEYFVIL